MKIILFRFECSSPTQLIRQRSHVGEDVNQGRKHGQGRKLSTHAVLKFVTSKKLGALSIATRVGSFLHESRADHVRCIRHHACNEVEDVVHCLPFTPGTQLFVQLIHQPEVITANEWNLLVLILNVFPDMVSKSM